MERPNLLVYCVAWILKWALSEDVVINICSTTPHRTPKLLLQELPSFCQAKHKFSHLRLCLWWSVLIWPLNWWDFRLQTRSSKWKAHIQRLRRVDYGSGKLLPASRLGEGYSRLLPSKQLGNFTWGLNLAAVALGKSGISRERICALTKIDLTLHLLNL